MPYVQEVELDGADEMREWINDALANSIISELDEGFKPVCATTHDQQSFKALVYKTTCNYFALREAALGREDVGVLHPNGRRHELGETMPRHGVDRTQLERVRRAEP